MFPLQDLESAWLSCGVYDRENNQRLFVGRVTYVAIATREIHGKEDKPHEYLLHNSNV